MNKALEEFKDLRTVYSGRIDEAIKNQDDEALEVAKADYKKILEKYMNVACQVLSEHTNHPFKVTKKTHKGTVLRGEKSVLKDIETMRDSLNFKQYPELVVADIKNALDVVDDYYNKIISEEEVGRTDQTKFSFQIIFGSIIVPFFVTIMALISATIINKFLPSYQHISTLKEFIDLSKKGTDNSVMLLVVLMINMGLTGLLCFIYSSKSKNSVLNKKQVMLIPVSIINLFIVLGPLHYVVNYLFSPFFNSAMLTLVNNLSDFILTIVSILILIIGLAGSNYDAGDYRVKMGVGHILMIVFLSIFMLLPLVYQVASEYINLSVISNNIIFITIMAFGVIPSLIRIVCLVYLLIVINKHVFIDERYELTYRIICVIVSILLVVGSVLLTK